MLYTCYVVSVEFVDKLNIPVKKSCSIIQSLYRFIDYIYITNTISAVKTSMYFSSVNHMLFC